MKRLPNKFWKELYELRKPYGQKEYSRDDLLPATKALVKSYLVTEDELLTDAAVALLDRMDKSDDHAGEGLFPHDAHVALGEKRRICRGAMNIDQLRRRQTVINTNKIATDTAWANETKWNESRIRALKDHPPETKVSEVLDESGDELVLASA